MPAPRLRVRGTRYSSTSTIQGIQSMMKAHLCAVFVAAAVCFSASHAQTLKDKEYFAAHEKYLADSLALTSKQCGIDMTSIFDWSNVAMPAAVQPRCSPSGYCGAVFE